MATQKGIRTGRKISNHRRNLWALTLEGVPAIIMLTLLGGPFLTGYLLYLGATSEQIGIVLAMTTFVNFIQIFVAFLMQKMKNRYWPFVITGALHRVLWASTGLIPFIFPKDLWVAVYIILYTLAFVANAAVGVMWTSLVGDMVPAGVRGRYMGIRNTILNALGSIALFVGGQILDAYPGEKGFTILFTIIGIFTVLNIIGFINYPRIPMEKSTEVHFIPMLKKPFQDRMFLRAVLFLAAWLFLQGVTVPLFSYVMLDILHISYKWVSTITVVQTIFMMISLYIWGNLNVRYSNKQLLLCTLPIIACSCLSWGLIAVLPTIVVLFLVHILLGVGTGGFNQLAFNFIIGDTPKSERPMFIGVYSALTGFAAFLGPLLGGWLYKQMAVFSPWVRTYGISSSIGLLLLLFAIFVGRLVLSEKKQQNHESSPFQRNTIEL